MTVNGNGPVRTELEIDTAAGYGYIKFHHDPALGAFTKKVNGTCDPQEMIEEENNVQNNSIAAIFNGRELPMIKTRTLRKGNFIETDPSGKLELEVLHKIRS